MLDPATALTLTGVLVVVVTAAVGLRAARAYNAEKAEAGRADG